MAEIVDDLADHADEVPEPKEGGARHSFRLPIVSKEELTRRLAGRSPRALHCQPQSLGRGSRR